MTTQVCVDNIYIKILIRIKLNKNIKLKRINKIRLIKMLNIKKP